MRSNRFIIASRNFELRNNNLGVTYEQGFFNSSFERAEEFTDGVNKIVVFIDGYISQRYGEPLEKA